MWVNKKQHAAYLDLLHRTIRDLQDRLDTAQRQTRDRDTTIERFRREASRANIECSAARAYYDLARLHINELKLERAALLTRLLPGLSLAVPTVRTGIVEAPGASLEDMGDAAAGVFGDAALMPEDPDQRRETDLDEIQGQQLFSDPDEHVEGLGGIVVRSAVGA